MQSKLGGTDMANKLLWKLYSIVKTKLQRAKFGFKAFLKGHRSLNDFMIVVAENKLALNCTQTKSRLPANLFDTRDENNNPTAHIINVLSLITNTQRGSSVCLGFGKCTHTNRKSNACRNMLHSTPAESITQQTSDPVNYMWPLPEVRGHSW